MAVTASTIQAGPGRVGPKISFAVAAPTVTNDVAAGFFKGDLFVDTVLHKWYGCESAAAGAAVWTALN